MTRARFGSCAMATTLLLIIGCADAPSARESANPVPPASLLSRTPSAPIATKEAINPADAALSAALTTHDSSAPELPAPKEFELRTLFRKPVGPRGLEYSDYARALDGQRVRVSGYMVRFDRVQWGQFMLTTSPVTVADREFGPADELPPDTLFVGLPESLQTVILHRPGPFSIVGTLRLTETETVDGRRYFARLEVSETDLRIPPPASAPSTTDSSPGSPPASP